MSNSDQTYECLREAAADVNALRTDAFDLASLARVALDVVELKTNGDRSTCYLLERIADRADRQNAKLHEIGERLA